MSGRRVVLAFLPPIDFFSIDYQDLVAHPAMRNGLDGAHTFTETKTALWGTLFVVNRIAESRQCPALIDADQTLPRPSLFLPSKRPL